MGLKDFPGTQKVVWLLSLVLGQMALLHPDQPTLHVIAGAPKKSLVGDRAHMPIVLRSERTAFARYLDTPLTPLPCFFEAILKAVDSATSTLGLREK